MEICLKSAVFPIFLKLCPRDFFFFQINENYRKKSRNGEIKNRSLRDLVQSYIKVIFFPKKVAYCGTDWFKNNF